MTVEAPPDADLLIVGAGAKAAAIAAKVHVLNELGLGPLEVTIVERAEPAASWLGRNGMTSGEEPLAIPPIKDVGFPYQSHHQFGEAGDAIDAALLPFSWQRHATERGEYGAWVNAGSPSVRHRDYGGYLSWVLERATEGVRLLRGRVEAVTIEDDPECWEIAVAERGDPGDPERHRGGALLLTGPGVHRALPHDPTVAGRIFHCDSHRSEFARIEAGAEVEIAILGGGESALSALVFLRAFRPRARITVFTPMLPISRGESFLENRVFADPDCVAWERLDQATRRDFVKHADRGVFDAGTIASLAGDERASFELGRALHAGAGAASALALEYEGPEGVVAREFDHLVNCTGFDLLAQLRELFPDRVRALVEREVGPIWGDVPPGTEVPIGRALELRGFSPRLHIPGLGGLSQGPGFANLGCLGLTANRVLQPLLPALAADRLAVRAESQ
ncbi:MAG: SidA/IucD/PvdA family monooxygenase [Actinobacteria bacterium]|nr:SidA/IucD/PvdA family monooxygenase [Actinomycetota bacterium]